MNRTHTAFERRSPPCGCRWRCARWSVAGLLLACLFALPAAAQERYGDDAAVYDPPAYDSPVYDSVEYDPPAYDTSHAPPDTPRIWREVPLDQYPAFDPPPLPPGHEFDDPRLALLPQEELPPLPPSADAPPQPPAGSRDGLFWYENTPGEVQLQPDPYLAPLGRWPGQTCWEVTAEALFLNRSTSNSQTLAQDASASAILDVQGLDFDYETAPRIFLRRKCGCGALEIGYFGLDGWDSSFTETTAGMTINLPDGTDLAANDATYVASSELYSVEVNWRRPLTNWLDTLIGMRWIEFNDNLVTTSTSYAGGVYNIATRNDYVGPQVGLDWIVLEHGGPFAIEALLKIGLASNASSQSTQITALGTSSSTSRTSAAMFIDTDISARYRINTWLDLRAGYNLIWLDRVTLAGEQFSFGNTVSDGHLLLHGPHAGIVIRY